jgi:hypothetical protein
MLLVWLASCRLRAGVTAITAGTAGYGSRQAPMGEVPATGFLRARRQAARRRAAMDLRAGRSDRPLVTQLNPKESS